MQFNLKSKNSQLESKIIVDKNKTKKTNTDQVEINMSINFNRFKKKEESTHVDQDTTKQTPVIPSQQQQQQQDKTYGGCKIGFFNHSMSVVNFFMFSHLGRKRISVEGCSLLVRAIKGQAKLSKKRITTSCPCKASFR